MTRLSRYLWLGGVAVAAPAIAQTVSPESVTTLPDLVVSATRIETDPEKVGSTVSVITGEDIETRGATHVFEALQGVPGLTFSRSGGLGSLSVVRIRGANPGQTQVRVDGILLNDPSTTDNAFDFSGLSVAGIGRIEVLRGPQSALYGADAVGGVIDIQTKRGEGPVTATAEVEGGSYGTWRGSAGVSGGGERFGLRLDAQAATTDGFSNVVGTAEKDGLRERSARGRLTLDPTDIWSVDLVAGYSDQRYDYDDFGADADNVGKKTTRYGKIDNIVRLFDERLENIVSLAVVDIDRSDIAPDGWTRHSTFAGTRTTAEYRANLHVDQDDVATLGAAYQRESVETANDGVSDVDKALSMASVYGQYLLAYDKDPFGWDDSLTLTAGVRHDHHDRFGGATTVRLTGAYRIEATATTFRSSIGTGFKAPTAYQLYSPYGDSGLKAERSVGADAGVEQSLLQGAVNLRGTVFWNRYTDMIGFDMTTWRYTNTGRAMTRGVELSAEWSPVEALTLSASYTFLDSEDKTRDRPLERRPKHSGRIAADWKPVTGLTVGTDVTLVGKQLDSYSTNIENDGYAVVNARVSYEVTKGVSVFGRIDNLADAKYQEVLGYNTARRSFYAGVKAAF